MLVTKRSLVSGIIRSRELDITEDQMNRYLAGEHLGKVFSNLNASDREFIHTGMTDEEWDDVCKEEDDL